MWPSKKLHRLFLTLWSLTGDQQCTMPPSWKPTRTCGCMIGPAPGVRGCLTTCWCGFHLPRCAPSVSLAHLRLGWSAPAPPLPWRHGPILCVSSVQSKRCSNKNWGTRGTAGFSNWRASMSSAHFTIGQMDPSRQTKEALGRHFTLSGVTQDCTCCPSPRCEPPWGKDIGLMWVQSHTSMQSVTCHSQEEPHFLPLAPFDKSGWPQVISLAVLWSPSRQEETSTSRTDGSWGDGPMN